MVIGMKASNMRGPSIQLEYQIHLQEIRPWPPSQSLKSLHSAIIQWEHNDNYSGSTNPVVGSNIGDGKIQFNHTFRLPITLLRDGDVFHNNCLELNLFEPRRDKTVKGQLLETAIIDLSEYVSVKEAVDAFPGDIVIFSRVLNLLRGLSSIMKVRINYVDIMRPFAESVLQCNIDNGPRSNVQWIYNTPIHSDVEAKEMGNADKILGIQVLCQVIKARTHVTQGGTQGGATS